jgi:hypothetical protein
MLVHIADSCQGKAAGAGRLPSKSL